ncbi:hypothetical protein ASG31_06215 [Chryseobacterium sp. Leaf404]|uniref:alpha/beta hydrolase n=1 Tax=unclassified Chryseobacterium TaxID=2593645 RepID=UPI0006F20A05|nr:MULTISPECIES: alpha/beta hydrolase [unclassified Chryseobacterium]KQT18319.1 hypothetical protein ASG31_06215 [Chryseobacterium sp. Leaf404]
MPNENSALSRNNYVSVGKDGTFFPGNNPLFNSTPQEIDQLFQNLKDKNLTKIVLYFHGGLVPARDGMETAGRIVKYVEKDTNAHPICFIWETGLQKTVADNLDIAQKSDFFKKLMVKVIKVAGKKLGIEAVDNIGNSKGVETMKESEIHAELNREEPFKNYQVNAGSKSASVIYAETISSDAAIEARILPEIEAELEEEIESDQEFKNSAAAEKSEQEARLLNPEYAGVEVAEGKGIISSAKLIAAAVKITYNVIKRHIQKTDHDFYPTVIEEILREIYVSNLGNWLWGNMKKKAAAMWKSSDFTGDYQDWHVGSYVIKKLEEYQKESGKPLTVDLVGHSAGSIVICELFKKLKAEKSELKFRNVMFFAPACRCDLFDEAILSSPERFSSFRIFTMKDDLEKQDHLVKHFYPRSLLYLISGILEEERDAHILGLQRHITGNKPYIGDMFTRIKTFLADEGKIVYSKSDDTALNGFKTGSLSHGGFDDDKETTLDSMVYLINQ